MPKTIIVGGYGSGISKAVAEKFGAQGFAVALVARGADKLAAGVKELEGRGIKAAAFPQISAIRNRRARRSRRSGRRWDRSPSCNRRHTTAAPAI